MEQVGGGSNLKTLGNHRFRSGLHGKFPFVKLDVGSPSTMVQMVSHVYSPSPQHLPRGIISQSCLYSIRFFCFPR